MPENIKLQFAIKLTQGGEQHSTQASTVAYTMSDCVLDELEVYHDGILVGIIDLGQFKVKETNATD